MEISWDSLGFSVHGEWIHCLQVHNLWGSLDFYFSVLEIKTNGSYLYFIAIAAPESWVVFSLSQLNTQIKFKMRKLKEVISYQSNATVWVELHDDADSLPSVPNISHPGRMTFPSPSFELLYFFNCYFLFLFFFFSSWLFSTEKKSHSTCCKWIS